MSSVRDRGRERFAEVMGFAVPDVPGDPFFEITLDHLFANLWSRPGLSVRDRRLLTLAILIPLANETVLRLHLQAAMQAGQLTDTEIDEVILHVAHYAGWPGAAVASQVVRQLRAERPASG